MAGSDYDKYCSLKEDIGSQTQTHQGWVCAF
jgi:hypothetical protein